MSAPVKPKRVHCPTCRAVVVEGVHHECTCETCAPLSALRDYLSSMRCPRREAERNARFGEQIAERFVAAGLLHNDESILANARRARALLDRLIVLYEHPDIEGTRGQERPALAPPIDVEAGLT